MKKFFKYLIVFVFIIPMAFMFVACGNDGNSDPSNPGTPSNPSNMGKLYGIYVQYEGEEKTQQYHFSNNFEYGDNISEVFNYKIIANYQKKPYYVEIAKDDPNVIIEYFTEDYSENSTVQTPIATISETPDVGSYVIKITFNQQHAEIHIYVSKSTRIDPNYTMQIKSENEEEFNTYAYNSADDVVVSVKDANNNEIEQDYFSLYYLTESGYEEYQQCETYLDKQEFLQNASNNGNNYVWQDEGKIQTTALNAGTYYLFTYVYDRGNYTSSYSTPVQIIVKKGTLNIRTVGDFELCGKYYVLSDTNINSLTLQDLTIQMVDYSGNTTVGLFCGDTTLSTFGQYVFQNPTTLLKGNTNASFPVNFVLNDDYINNYNAPETINIPVHISKYLISRPGIDINTYEDENVCFETYYTGEDITFTSQLSYFYNASLLSVTNNTKTNAGTYTSVISINEPEFYAWESDENLDDHHNYGEYNSTSNTVSFTWKIKKAYQYGFSVKVKDINGNTNAENKVAWYNNNGGMDIEIVYGENVIHPEVTNWFWAFVHDGSSSTGYATLLNSSTGNSRQNKINVTSCGETFEYDSFLVYLANDGDDNFEPYGDVQNVTSDYSFSHQFFVEKADLPIATEIQAQLDAYPETVQLSADNNDQFTVPASMLPTNNYSSQGTWVLKNRFNDIVNVGESVEEHSSAGDTSGWTLSFVPTNNNIYKTLYKGFTLELIYKDLPVAEQINQDLEVITQTTHKLYYRQYNGDDYAMNVPSTIIPSTDYSQYGSWSLQDQNDHYWTIGGNTYDVDRVAVTGAGEWKLKFQPTKGGVYRAIEVTVNVIVQVPLNVSVSDDLENYKNQYGNCEYSLKIVNNKITVPAELIPTNTHSDVGDWKLFDNNDNEVLVGTELERTTAGNEEWHFMFIPKDTNYANYVSYIWIYILQPLPSNYYSQPQSVINDVSLRTVMASGGEFAVVTLNETAATSIIPLITTTSFTEGYWTLFDHNGDSVYDRKNYTGMQAGTYTWTYKFHFNNNYGSSYYANDLTLNLIVELDV